MSAKRVATHLTDRELSRANPPVRAPIAPPARVRIFHLPIERVRPVVRIAHALSGGLHIAPRMIVDHEIVLVTKGRTTCAIGAQRHELQPGYLIVLPAFVTHHFIDSPPATRHVAVHFDLAGDVPGTRAGARSAAYGVELSHGQSLPTCVAIPATAAVQAMLGRIVDAFALRTPAGDLEASSLLAVIIARLLTAPMADDGRAPHHTGAHAWRVRRVTDHIEAHLSGALDAVELSRVAGLSESRFRAIFRRSLGVAPKQYVLQRRIAMARTLLTDPDRGLKDVARAVGFADEFHFSKAFRHVDGIPPSVYREQALASRF
jgi:AraC-like DNA-binding protein